ncbi:MAG TPA: SMI1/KNR4 family protein [Pirellulaceae bacterium]|nr:SMI1/KNR4 family protein [Pirellulaceae bacterium]
MFENFAVIGDQLVLSTPAEVDTAEAELGIRFPDGYREFVTRFGEGVLGGCYIRIYPPRRILSGDNNFAEWRQRIDEYWFWDAGREVLTKEQALNSVIIGDTLDGDELIVHPSNPQRVYVLPRHSEEIYIAGDGLPAAIEWLCNSDTLTDPFDERNFEPFNSRHDA